MKRLFDLEAHPSSLILKESPPRTPRWVANRWQSKVLWESLLLSNVTRPRCVRICARVYVCVSPRINRAQVECLLKPILYSLAVPPTLPGGFHYRSESFRPPGCWSKNPRSLWKASRGYYQSGKNLRTQYCFLEKYLINTYWKIIFNHINRDLLI